MSTTEDVDSDVAATVVEDCNVSTTEDEKSDVPIIEDACQIVLEDDKISLKIWLEEHLVLVKEVRAKALEMVEAKILDTSSILAEADEIVDYMNLHILTESEEVLEDLHLCILAEAEDVLEDIKHALSDADSSHSLQAAGCLAKDGIQDIFLVNQEEVLDICNLSDEPSLFETSFDGLSQHALQLRGSQVYGMFQLEPPDDVGQLRGDQLQDVMSLEPPHLVSKLRGDGAEDVTNLPASLKSYEVAKQEESVGMAGHIQVRDGYTRRPCGWTQDNFDETDKIRFVEQILPSRDEKLCSVIVTDEVGRGIDERNNAQVTSSNLALDCFSPIDPSFVSGTWLLPPVPTHHGQLLGRPPQSLLHDHEEEQDVQIVQDAEHGGVGNRGQVPCQDLTWYLPTATYESCSSLSPSPANADPVEGRFDIHLRIPEQVEMPVDVRKVVDGANVCQVDYPIVDVNGQIGGLETVPAFLAVHVWDPGPEDIAGNSYEVSGKGDPSLYDPASVICQADHQLYPPVSVPPEPRQSPKFLAVPWRPTLLYWTR